MSKNNRLVSLSFKKSVKLCESGLFCTGFYLIKGIVYYCSTLSGKIINNEGDYDTFMKKYDNAVYSMSFKLVTYPE